MEFQYKKYILEIDEITIRDAFLFLKECNTALHSDEESDYREILIRLLEKKERIPDQALDMFNASIEAYGLYPYLDTRHLSNSSLMRYEYHRSKYLPKIILHQEQQRVIERINCGNSVILSAPTSFGKSLIIEHLVASQKYKNIVVIQPTLALIDETRKKLSKYKETFTLIVSTAQQPSQKNIFIFTPERVLEYTQLPKIDFFIIDEFYKLSIERDDDRATILNCAFYKLLRHTNHYYLLGPAIKKISSATKKKLSADILFSDFLTVATDEFDFYNPTHDEDAKTSNLIKVLNKFGKLGQTIIYCSDPKRVNKIAMSYTDHIKSKNKTTESHISITDIIEWITKNIHPRWKIIDALKNRIGIHHGALPRHLGSSIIDAFNTGHITHLFCTSTIIEGVNTTAKNVVLFDRLKGKKQIDYFDYKNIAGRSGRMQVHYVGNVISLEKQPPHQDLSIDIPILSQNAPEEILIHINEGELSTTSKTKLEQYKKTPPEFKSIIRSNTGVKISSQINILDQIIKNENNIHSLLSWSGFPSYEQAVATFTIAWTHLRKRNESMADVLSAKQLAYLCREYYKSKSIGLFISKQIDSEFTISKIPDKDTRIDAMTHFCLNFIRQWADYKAPKWLLCIHSIQEYAFKTLGMKPGNYKAFAAGLESKKIPQELAPLLDYGIPSSALKKISEQYKFTSTDDALKKIKRIDLEKLGLLNYEITKIKGANL